MSHQTDAPFAPEAVAPMANHPQEMQLSHVIWNVGNCTSAAAYEKISQLHRDAALDAGVSWCQVGLLDTLSLWFMVAVGCITASFPLQGLPALQSYINYLTSGKSEILSVEDLSKDPRFSGHPTVTSRPHLRFYAGAPMLSRGGHCLGILTLGDTATRCEPTTHQKDLLQKHAAEAVDVLQGDMLELLGSPLVEEALPAVFFDAASPQWPIVGANSQWEVLTGTTVDLMHAPGGFFTVFRPESHAELVALRMAVAVARKIRAVETSLPSILIPTDPSGAKIQFAFAFKPFISGGDDIDDDDIWMAEVHAVLEMDLSLTALSLFSNPPPGVGSTHGHITCAAREGEGGLNPRTSFDAAWLNLPGSIFPPLPRLKCLKVDKFIGSGSYGQVFSGRLENCPVAVKLVQDALGTDWDAKSFESRFEAVISADLNHPNVVKTLDWCIHKDQFSGKIWIVQELCDQGTLSNFLTGAEGSNEGRLNDMRSILETALDIARGMQYIHSRDIVHADLSSNNVLLASANNPRGFVAKVIDFGLSTLGNLASKGTQTHGTLSHMPPELITDGKMGKAGDVYSFGVILWELYNHQKAWANSSLAQVIYAVTIRNEMLQMPATAPAAYSALTNACMSKERENRPTLDEIVPQIETMLGALPVV